MPSIPLSWFAGFIFHKENVLVGTDKDYNCISRFTRGYEVVADIAALGKDSSSQLESKLNRYYYTVDEQGSTIFITDKNQQVKNEYYYDAFGNVLDSKEDIHNRITYVGQQFDGITGQYYLRVRFYNPVIGRFTQEDVYRGDGLNLYAYCSNNPIIYYDPSGYKRECPKSKDDNFNDVDNKKYVHSVEETKKAYSEKVKDKTKVVGTYTGTESNSTILKNELKLAGIDNPPYSFASHHIVPAVDPRAIPAQNVLKEVKIEFNSATNGVNLPNKGFGTNPYITTESPHTGKHIEECLTKTNEIILNARETRLAKTGKNSLSHNDPGDVAAITKALDNIRGKLLDGKIKCNNIKK